MTRNTALLVSILALVACGNKGSSGTAADASAANAAIPAAWKGKIEFVTQTLGKDEGVSVPAPKGWKPGFLDGTVEPPDGNKDFGFATNLRAGKTCGGECKSKDAAAWESAANESSFNNMLAHKPAPKVIKDEKRPGSRVMIAQDQNTDGNMNQTFVLVAYWKDGADRFYFCNASLAEVAKDLAPAFEQACTKMAVDF